MAKKSSDSHKSARAVYTFGIVFTLFTLSAYMLGLDGGLEHKWHDTLFLMITPKDPDPKISIAAIDQDSINEFGWPFPRKYHAQLIRSLKKLGAASIGMDVLFVDPDKRDKTNDIELVNATREAGNVIQLSPIITENVSGSALCSRQMPISGLAQASQYVAHPNVEGTIDSDGHIRKLVLFDSRVLYSGENTDGRACIKCEGMPLAVLNAAVYASFIKKSLKELYDSADWSEPVWINYRKLGMFLQHPGWSDSKDSAHKYVDAVYQHISVVDIIKGNLSQEERARIKDGIVFIGATVVGAFDHYPSPFLTAWPGVELHANSLDNLLHGDFMKFAGAGWVVLVVLIFIWMPVFLRKISPLTGAVTALAVFAGYLILNFVLFSKGIRMDFVLPSFTLLGSFLFVIVHKAMTEGKEKKWIKNTFGQYLSPKVVDVITKDPSKLALGGEKRDMTVFFLDIAHFTTISEKMDPEKLTMFLNKYLSALTDVILKHDGVVDKYIGDCIMAFWNAPLDQKEHKTFACYSAIECIEAVNRLNQELPEGVPEKPAVRIGLNSGHMVVGNMGSNTRFSYTVIGDEVNLGSRLEGANKYFGSRIMASEATYSQAKDKVDARMLGRVRVVGKAIPITVYELLAKKGELSPSAKSLLERYSEGTDFFYKREFEKAEKSFKAALEAVPGDAPSQLYLRIAKDYMVIPPPQDWDGVFNLTAK